MSIRREPCEAMLRSTEGIVLKTFPYGEADLLATYFTLDFGLIRAFVKSPRKIKSRYGSSLEPLTHARIALWGREDAHLPRLTQSDIIRPFQGLREDLRCFLMAAEAVELVLDFMAERQADPRLFRLLRSVLGMMEQDCARRAVLLFKIRFLEHKGYAPGLSACARCGARAVRFYASQGSVMCDPCAARTGIRHSENGKVPEVSPGSLRLYESLSTWEIEKTPRIKASEAMVSELSEILSAHIEHTVSKPSRTRAFTQPT